MTATVTTPTDPTRDAEAEFELVSFDLYKDIHKGIRGELFRITSTAGSLDPGERCAREQLAEGVRTLFGMLTFHAAHEDEFVQPHIEVHAPFYAEVVASDHARLEGRMAEIQARAERAADHPAAEQRGRAHHLYRELAAFTSAYLEHQDFKECKVMPALDAVMGTDELVAVNQAIVGSIPPEQMAWSLGIMLPAMNVDDRVEILGGMQAGAPPEVFAGCARAGGLDPGSVRLPGAHRPARRRLRRDRTGKGTVTVTTRAQVRVVTVTMFTRCTSVSPPVLPAKPRNARVDLRTPSRTSHASAGPRMVVAVSRSTTDRDTTRTPDAATLRAREPVEAILPTPGRQEGPPAGPIADQALGARGRHRDRRRPRSGRRRGDLRRQQRLEELELPLPLHRHHAEHRPRVGVGGRQAVRRGQRTTARRGAHRPGHRRAAPTQLVTKDLQVGTGETVTANANITVDYIGVACSTGKVFDASYGKQPATFGLDGVIPGWSTGIPGMKVGGTRLLGIPASEAYGSQGSRRTWHPTRRSGSSSR